MAHAYAMHTEEMGSSSMDRVRAILVMEQVYGYSHFAARDVKPAENFPGVLRARARYENEDHNPRIGPGNQYHLLDGQASQGVYARYATPMRRMKLIEHQRSKVFWPEGWEAEVVYGTDSKRIVSAFTWALKEFSKKTEILQFGQIFPEDSDLSDLLHLCTGTAEFSQNQRKFWKQSLGLLRDDLLRALAESRPEYSVEYAIRSLHDKGLDEDHRLWDVIACEEYLKYLDGSFNFLLALTDFEKAESRLKSVYPDFEDRLLRSQENFKNLSPPGGDGEKRLEQLSAFHTNTSEFLRELLTFHQKLQQNRTVLTPTGSGTSIETTRPDWCNDEATGEDLFKHWGRGYYVSSLWNLAKGFEGEEESQ